MENLHNISIERSVLATIMFEPEQFTLNQNRIMSEDFYLPFHRYMCEVMHELEREDKPLDESFVKIKLLKEERFDEMAMLEVLSTNPLPNIVSYLEELRSKAQLRELMALSNKTRVDIAQSLEVHEIIGHISKTCDEISDKNSTCKIKDMPTIADEYHAEFSQAAENKDYIGFKSGLTSLDNIVGAFAPGDLVVVCARPSMGKTSFVTTVTNYADEKGHGTLFDSLEMKSSKIFRRLLSQKSEETLNDLKKGVVKNPERYKSIYKKLKYSKNIIIHDESYITIHQLVAKAAMIFRKNSHIKYWVVDHIRYIKKDGKNIPQEVSEITKLIKKTAQEYGVVVFLLSQLNRANEMRQNKRPMLSDLRESGAVEEDAEIVLVLHRESYYDRNDPSIPEPSVNEAEILVLKNRDGSSGCAKCWFDGPHASFSNYPPFTVHEYDDKIIDFGGQI